MADQVANPEPGSPEYNAQMEKAAENVVINGGLQNEPEGDAGSEKLLAGKYKTVEELEAAFAALSEGKKPEGEGEGGQTDDNQENTENVDPKEATADQAKDALKEVGLDFNDFSNEFAANGSLSDDSYKKLESAGIPKEMVDAYIEGQQAKADLIVEKVTSVVGGRESYQKMIAWAQANMSAEDIAAYDRVATQGDVLTAQLAAEGLYRRYTAAVGTNNPFLSGSTNGQSHDLFQSTSQVTAAMRDPRYRTDPAYRKEVAEKIARSNVF